jgi:two-component system response regulator QseB
MRVLLVEDDTMIGAAVHSGLRHEGFAVDWVRDGEAAERSVLAERFDAVLLDLGLPRSNGIEVLRKMRARGDATPVLIVTAQDEVAERVRGLDAGADDYLVKPFEFAELAARIRALLRRRAGRATPVIEHRGVALDPATQRVTQNGKDVALSPREFALLALLMDRPGALLSRTQIEERLYGWGEEIESNAVDVHVHALRRKLGADLIQTVRGVGYRVAAQSLSQ